MKMTTSKNFTVSEVHEEHLYVVIMLKKVTIKEDSHKTVLLITQDLQDHLNGQRVHTSYPLNQYERNEDI